ncbi:hypothetical protein BpHYR1_014197 [Brachionus plicatilis]|uniref:Uncharacterized protein n=1 Tax=Brachionus plicatilis TaxID=10195 RepID=A0A3M7S9C5_BRAPC|nr:hypothetical protein BpHYR1_014197 [Brachionus plicatilis]
MNWSFYTCNPAKILLIYLFFVIMHFALIFSHRMFTENFEIILDRSRSRSHFSDEIFCSFIFQLLSFLLEKLFRDLESIHTYIFSQYR